MYSKVYSASNQKPRTIMEIEKRTRLMMSKVINTDLEFNTTKIDIILLNSHSKSLKE